MQNKRQLGLYYEEKAHCFLCKQGLTFLAKNHGSQLGEIDLIMQDHACLVFIEVRYRKNELYGDAQSTVTKKKQSKVIQAAYNWMQQQQIDIETKEFRFDVFAITGDNYCWIKNAFDC
ncbi:YraN family protein [Orbus sturtevantii]|uniref:YraN family protein n=1 Tax=Orbus sturtevantii TaxID=3074109 RepID=UPI00370D092D